MVRGEIPASLIFSQRTSGSLLSSLVSKERFSEHINPVRRRCGTDNREAILIHQQKQPKSTPTKKNNCLPESFVLCERATGAVRFRVEATPDGSVSVDQIAGLLAMHCLMRGQTPEDFEIMVLTRESLPPDVAERARRLLTAGRVLGAGVKVSRREHDVLDGVLKNLANKQIAAQLNVSERTVKFHVSSLLAKYGVTDRVALCREVLMGGAFIGVSLGPGASLQQCGNRAGEIQQRPSRQAPSGPIPLHPRHRYGA